jgi:hypothetical protein
MPGVMCSIGSSFSIFRRPFNSITSAVCTGIGFLRRCLCKAVLFLKRIWNWLIRFLHLPVSLAFVLGNPPSPNQLPPSGAPPVKNKPVLEISSTVTFAAAEEQPSESTRSDVDVQTLKISPPFTVGPPYAEDPAGREFVRNFAEDLISWQDTRYVRDKFHKADKFQMLILDEITRKDPKFAAEIRGNSGLSGLIIMSEGLLSLDEGTRNAAIIALSELKLYDQLHVLEYVRSVDTRLAQQILNTPSLDEGCTRYAQILRASTVAEAVTPLFEGPGQLVKDAGTILAALPAKATAEIFKALPSKMGANLIANNFALRHNVLHGLPPQEAAKMLLQSSDITVSDSISRRQLAMSPRWLADVVAHMPPSTVVSSICHSVTFLTSYEDFAKSMVKQHPKFELEPIPNNIAEEEAIIKSSGFGDIRLELFLLRASDEDLVAFTNTHGADRILTRFIDIFIIGNADQVVQAAKRLCFLVDQGSVSADSVIELISDASLDDHRWSIIKPHLPQTIVTAVEAAWSRLGAEPGN